MMVFNLLACELGSLTNYVTIANYYDSNNYNELEIIFASSFFAYDNSDNTYFKTLLLFFKADIITSFISF